MRTFVARRASRTIFLRARLACSFILLVRRQQRSAFRTPPASLALRATPARFADEVSHGTHDREAKEYQEKIDRPELAQDRGHQLTDDEQNKRIQRQPQQSGPASLRVDKITEAHSRNLP